MNQQEINAAKGGYDVSKEYEVASALEMAVGGGLVGLVDRVSEELDVERRFVWSEIAYVATRNARGERP